MNEAAYHLGEIEWRGDTPVITPPWYIAPGREADLFATFLAARSRPPQTTAEANAVLQATFDLCVANPAFFGHEFGEIPLGAGGSGPFNQWTPGQRRFYGAIQGRRAAGKPVRAICCKARREGVSTEAELIGAWLSGFHPHRNGLIAAHEDDASNALFAMCRRFLDAIPEHFRADRMEDSRGAIEFAAPLNGRIVHRTVQTGAGTKRNAGKGRAQALHWLHASEASRWDEPETFWNGVIQCVEDYPETYVLIESTANGYGWFKEMWDEAAAGWELRFDRATGRLSWTCVDRRASRSDLVPVFLSWLEEPKYKLAFEADADRRALLRSLDPDERALVDTFGATPEQLHWRRRTLYGSKFKGDLAAFREEFPATPSEAFRSSGRKVFDMAALDRAERRIGTSSPLPTRHRVSVDAAGAHTLVPAEDGEIIVWVAPVQDRSYALGVDGSYGKAHGDFMCAQVLDMDTWEQVAQVRVQQSDADEFAEMVSVVGRTFHDALAVVEVNGPGLAVLKALDRLEYPNFYFRTQPDDVTGKPKQSFGWWTSDKTRRWMVSELVQAVRTGDLVLHDMGTVEEMRGWVLKSAASGKTKEQPASSKGYDDRITALGIALVGGCIENGEGAPIVSRDVGTRKARHGERIDVRPTYDPDVARLLGRQAGLGGGNRIYDPILGANA